MTLFIVAMLALWTITEIRGWRRGLETATTAAAAAKTAAAFTTWASVAVTTATAAAAKTAAAFTTWATVAVTTATAAAKAAAAFTTWTAVAVTAAAAKAAFATWRTITEITARRTITKVAARRTRCALWGFSGHFDIDCLWAFAARVRFRVELDLLSVHQSRKSGPLYSRDVDEYVGAA